MRKLRISFSLAVMMLLIGLFSISAFAASSVLKSDPVGPAGVDLNGSLAPDITTNPAANDNGLENVNESGKGVTTNDGSSLGDVIKSDGMIDKSDLVNGHTQRTHGEYQNNTNSCASCHQTHTGASKNLLFKDGVYSTCTACHDGTLGFYNVFQASTAGTFGGDTTHDASMHMANDALTVSAAPGGNRTGTDEKSWGKEFNCASCHSPHGSYSDRLLNYNPNNMGATSSFDGGNAAWSKIYNFSEIATIESDVAAEVALDSNYDPKSVYGKFILVRGALSDLGVTPAGSDTAATIGITTFGFSVDHGHWTLALAKAPILYAYEYASPYKAYETRWFKLTDPTTDADGNKVPDEVDGITFPYTDATLADNTIFDGNDTGVLNINYQAGYLSGKDGKVAGADKKLGTADDVTITNPINDLNYGQVGRAYVVKLDLKQYPGADLTANQADALFKAGGKLSYVADANLGTNAFGAMPIKYSDDSTLYGYSGAGRGIQMSNYCAACHTDYLASSGKGTGEFSTAYRHTTEVDTYTCVRCHYAHGTDAYTMKDAEGNTYKDLTDAAFMTSKGKTAMDATTALNYLDDKNTSSALKKFTNMSGCWSCHNSSHAEQLINNDNGQQYTDKTQSWAQE